MPVMDAYLSKFDPDTRAFLQMIKDAAPARRAAERQARERASRSMVAADVCAECEREIAPSAPVARKRYPQANWCATCAGKRSGFGGSDWHRATCPACDRVVYTDWCYGTRRHLYCSQRCARRGEVARRVAAHAKARGSRTCPVCGEVFTPKRSDAQTCSHRCRTRLYRDKRSAVARHDERGVDVRPHRDAG